VTDSSHGDVCTKCDVCTHYQEASKIRVDQPGKLYNEEIYIIAVDKGVTFPICISSKEVLEVGNVVKIDLRCNIDGQIAVTAHTLIVSESTTVTKYIK